MVRTQSPVQMGTGIHLHPPADTQVVTYRATAVREPKDTCPEQGQKKRQLSGNRFVSSLSLPQFYKDRPRLFWENIDGEIIAEAPTQVREFDRHPLSYQGPLTKQNQSKARVITMACKNEHGCAEYVASKEVVYTNREAQEKAIKEVKLLYQLHHNHIIALVGCYVYDECLCILLYPVAKYDLWDFMSGVSDYNTEKDSHDPDHKYIPRLKSFFTCLCNALIYLHDRDEPIKHRDVKPENILIDHCYTVILTDFDISKEYPDRHSVITDGETACTVRYSCKAVVDGDPRDLSSDIFSLGCVFLEMVTVILGETFKNLYGEIGIRTRNGMSIAYCHKPKEVQAWLTHLKKRLNERLQIAQERKAKEGELNAQSRAKEITENHLDMILRMMSETHDEMPDLRDVQETFKNLAEPCPDCCPPVSYKFALCSVLSSLTVRIGSSSY